MQKYLDLCSELYGSLYTELCSGFLFFKSFILKKATECWPLVADTMKFLLFFIGIALIGSWISCAIQKYFLQKQTPYLNRINEYDDFVWAYNARLKYPWHPYDKKSTRKDLKKNYSWIIEKYEKYHFTYPEKDDTLSVWDNICKFHELPHSWKFREEHISPEKLGDFSDVVTCLKKVKLLKMINALFITFFIFVFFAFIVFPIAYKYF